MKCMPGGRQEEERKMEPQHPFFREKAMKEYRKKQEKDVLLRFVFPYITLLSRWHLLRRRVPELLQMNAVECGAACLAMILSYYGRKTSISEVYQNGGIGRDGLSALSIVQ